MRNKIILFLQMCSSIFFFAGLSNLFFFLWIFSLQNGIKKEIIISSVILSFGLAVINVLFFLFIEIFSEALEFKYKVAKHLSIAIIVTALLAAVWSTIASSADSGIYDAYSKSLKSKNEWVLKQKPILKNLSGLKKA